MNESEYTTAREGSCAACGDKFEPAPRGPVPPLCPACKRERRRVSRRKTKDLSPTWRADRARHASIVRWERATEEDRRAQGERARVAIAARWAGHEPKARAATPMVKCPYCPDLMPAWRKRCGKPDCKKAYQRDRCRDWQRQYSDEHGIGYAMALNPDKRRESRRNSKASRRGVPGAHTTADERAQHDRQHGKCFYRTVNPECDVSLKDGYHVEHVIPMGGDRPSSNGPENIVLSCSKCNLSKGSKDPMDWAGIMF